MVFIKSLRSAECSNSGISCTFSNLGKAAFFICAPVKWTALPLIQGEAPILIIFVRKCFKMFYLHTHRITFVFFVYLHFKFSATAAG